MALPGLAPAAPPAATPFVAADTTLRFLLVLQYLAAHHWMMPAAADTNTLCALGQALEAVLQLARLPVAPPAGLGWLAAALPAPCTAAAEHTETFSEAEDEKHTETFAEAEDDPEDYSEKYPEEHTATVAEAAKAFAEAGEEEEGEEELHAEEEEDEGYTEGYFGFQLLQRSLPLPPRYWEEDPEEDEEALPDALPTLPPLLGALPPEAWEDWALPPLEAPAPGALLPPEVSPPLSSWRLPTAEEFRTEREEGTRRLELLLRWAAEATATAAADAND